MWQAATSCRSLRSCCGSCCCRCRFCCGCFAVEVDMPLEPRQMPVPPRLPLLSSVGCHMHLLLPIPYSLFCFRFSDWTVCLFFTTSQYGYCYCHWRIAWLQFGNCHCNCNLQRVPNCGKSNSTTTCCQAVNNSLGVAQIVVAVAVLARLPCNRLIIYGMLPLAAATTTT